METFELVIEELKRKLEDPRHRNAHKLLREITALFEALDSREVSPKAFSKPLELLNQLLRKDQFILNQLRRLKMDVLDIAEKQHGLVAKGHYQRRWMLFGMILGIPFGTMFWTSFKNPAFIGIGMPIGLAIGIALGQQKDRQAEQEGRVLDFSVWK